MPSQQELNKEAPRKQIARTWGKLGRVSAGKPNLHNCTKLKKKLTEICQQLFTVH
jgi:hypothetical protein